MYLFRQAINHIHYLLAYFICRFHGCSLRINTDNRFSITLTQMYPLVWEIDFHTVYVANAGKELRQNVFAITQELRAAGIVTEADYQGRSLKAQFKQADKVGAKLILVLGGDELAAGKVKVRDMESHDEVLVDLANVVEAVRERL